MSDRVTRARKLFQEGFSCSQAVFTPFAVEAGLEEETALKLSQVMGGGMSHLGLTCGAVTGALLVIGLHFGRTRAEDRAAKELTYELAQKFCRQFTEKFGSINCTDLIGCSLKTPQGLELASQNNLFEKFCSGYVEEAGRLLEEILSEGKRKQKINGPARIESRKGCNKNKSRRR
ncbi:MAG: C-GCAxxG-C-C family protein [Candidatus Saccharicenans sp.]|jgi:C_GCAxxG_C_C family probable redox protein|nr:C-GCAxxG-C-C family protein [Candidatus Saccharicenans sp.]MDH7575716.1 C-GCAxxG-C-C family protein [Candidatus Saccharicenans sp.]